MTGKHKGLAARIRAVAPCTTASTLLHPQRTAGCEENATMPQISTGPVCEKIQKNTIKTKPLNTRLFKALCEEMGSEHTKLLFQTEVRWLSRGKVLTHLFELRDEVMLFLHHTDKLYDRLHDYQWLSQLAYLADVFSVLNALNLALQGKAVTVFNVQDKIKAARLKMELLCVRLDRQEFDCFPTLADFLLAADEELDGGTVAAFKEHLQGDISQN